MSHSHVLRFELMRSFIQQQKYLPFSNLLPPSHFCIPEIISNQKWYSAVLSQSYTCVQTVWTSGPAPIAIGHHYDILYGILLVKNFYLHCSW